MNVRLALVSILLATACKNGSEAKTAPATGSQSPRGGDRVEVPAGFDVNVVVSWTAKKVEIPGATITLDDPPTGGAIPDAGASASEPTPWRNDPRYFVLRYSTLEQSGVRCEVEEDAPTTPRGMASCKAMFIRNDKLYIPLEVPADERVSLDVNGTMVLVERADPDVHASSVEQETRNAQKGLQLLVQQALPQGYAVAYQTYNGGIESQGLVFKAVVRAKRGPLELVCTSFAAHDDADVRRALSVCMQMLDA